VSPGHASGRVGAARKRERLRSGARRHPAQSQVSPRPRTALREARTRCTHARKCKVLVHASLTRLQMPPRQAPRPCAGWRARPAHPARPGRSSRRPSQRGARLGNRDGRVLGRPRAGGRGGGGLGRAVVRLPALVRMAGRRVRRQKLVHQAAELVHADAGGGADLAVLQVADLVRIVLQSQVLKPACARV